MKGRKNHESRLIANKTIEIKSYLVTLRLELLFTYRERVLDYLCFSLNFDYSLVTPPHEIEKRKKVTYEPLNYFERVRVPFVALSECF